MYLVSQKTDSYFYDNFGKCGQIFTFSLLTSEKICGGSRN